MFHFCVSLRNFAFILKTESSHEKRLHSLKKLLVQTVQTFAFLRKCLRSYLFPQESLCASQNLSTLKMLPFRNFETWNRICLWKFAFPHKTFFVSSHNVSFAFILKKCAFALKTFLLIQNSLKKLEPKHLAHAMVAFTLVCKEILFALQSYAFALNTSALPQTLRSLRKHL